jgi:uncharacterized protein YbjQ (UPF0145 family)
MDCPKCTNYNNLKFRTDCWSCGEIFSEESIEKAKSEKIEQKIVDIINKENEEKEAALIQENKEAAIAQDINTENNSKLALTKAINDIILTTSFQVANREINHEIDIIGAEIVYGVNIFKDIFSSVRDIVGGRNKLTQNVLKDAKKEALDELRREAFEIGADAVIAIDLDYQELTGGNKSMLMLSVNGTAVKLKNTKTK